MPPGTQADEDPGLDWATWRQGPGYSRPVPPEPEPGHRAEPGPLHRGERGSHARPASGSDDEHYAEPPPRSAEQPRQAEPPRYAEPEDSAAPGAYAAAGDYGDGGSYAGAGTYRDAGDYEGPEGYGDPGIYGRPAGYEEPGGYPQQDAGQDTGGRGDDEDYSEFWEPEHRGGTHASRSGRTSTPAPPGSPETPGGTPGYQLSARGRRPTAFLIAVAAVIVVAGAVAAVLLLRHHGPARHAVAGGPPVPSSARTPVSSPGPATPSRPPSAPPLIGADGNLGIPRQIGSLLLNPSLTQRFVGPGVERQDANSFFIPVRDVISGFYTANPSVTTFTARDPRLMLLVAYLHGSGNIVSALHGFMTNRSFYGQQQVNPGPQGGVAACGLLPQQPAPVAHCMWADHNTYADFYAWGSSPSALAQTMIAIRPKIELTHG